LAALVDAGELRPEVDSVSAQSPTWRCCWATRGNPRSQRTSVRPGTSADRNCRSPTRLRW